MDEQSLEHDDHGLFSKKWTTIGLESGLFEGIIARRMGHETFIAFTTNMSIVVSVPSNLLCMLSAKNGVNGQSL